MADLDRLRPYMEWHEDHGDVLWWRFPIVEPPYVGSPLDCGYPINIQARETGGFQIGEISVDVGGWPFLDCDDGTLFWQPIRVPRDPREEPTHDDA